MSLLNRKPISIGRKDRILRDDRVFVVATDDTYAPVHYFEHLTLARVKVVVVPTPEGSGLSAPTHVVNRLKEAFNDVKGRSQIQAGDEFWVLIDTDHHFDDSNKKGTLLAIQTAGQAGFEIAVSNPCFELWLLLHHEEVSPGTIFENCDEVGQRIKTAIGAYNKTSIKSGQFPLERVPTAIARARLLESEPKAPWPSKTGTHVFKLLERVVPSLPK